MSEIICEYSSTIFTNENGYQVLSFKFMDGDAGPDKIKKGTSFTGFGYYLSAIPYATYTLSGEWVLHKTHGWQFQITSYREEIANNKDGILAFLKSGVLSGIGPKTAERIYAVFKEDTLNVLQNDPDQLLRVRGISKKSLEKIKESYSLNQNVRDIITLLAPHGVSLTLCKKVQETLGENAITKVKTNPYQLMKINGIGFPTCDKLALSLKLNPVSDNRLDAAVIYALRLLENTGSCYTDAPSLKKQIFYLLKGTPVSEEQIEARIRAVVKRKEAVYVKHLFCRKETYEAEWVIAKRVIELSMTLSDEIPHLDKKIEDWESKNGFTLHTQQKLAVSTALSNGFSVITGGPGRGKTTICKCIVDIRQKYGKKKTLCLLSPTGRAAKRLKESTAYSASTIHSRLQIHDLESFEDEVISDATILIDETSMLDIWVAKALLESIKNGCQVIFIGDIDQLPSVGCGAVLRDIIASGTIPVVELTEVYRQKDSDNLIVPNADKIKKGDCDLAYDNSTFVLYPTTDFKISARYMIALYKSKIALYGRDEVICLSPHHHADTYSSVDNLNRYLQEVTNHEDKNAEEVVYKNQIFRKNDLVMQTSNHDILTNGDIGVVIDIRTEENKKSLIVLFDDGTEYTYVGEDLGMLELAYATSIHKSQGSEYKCVILNLLEQHGQMLKRNLLYTAVTRAKKEVCLVSNETALKNAIQNEDTTKRITLLKEKLIQFKRMEEQKNPFKKTA